MFNKLFLSALLIGACGAFAAAQTVPATTTTKTTTTEVTKPKTVTTKTTTTVVQSADPNARAVRAAFDQLVKGIEKSDAEIVTGVYQNSPNTLYFNNNGSITRGWEQDRSNRESSYPKITNAKLTPNNVRVEMLGAGGAVLTCEWKLAQDFNGSPETASGRMTLVFKKIGKDWKVVHLHTSPDVVPANRPVLPSERTNN